MEKEYIREYKARRLPILTDTILSLIVDLSVTKRKSLLEDETPEELIIYWMEKYESEFDLHFDSLGASGADEIAWGEALAILNEQDSTDK